LGQGPTVGGPGGSGGVVTPSGSSLPINFTSPPSSDGGFQGSTGSSGGQLSSSPFSFIPPPMPDFDVHWINSNGGDWNSPQNWSTGAVPSPSQRIAIDASGSYTVTGAHVTLVNTFLLIG